MYDFKQGYLFLRCKNYDTIHAADIAVWIGISQKTNSISLFSLFLVTYNKRTKQKLRNEIPMFNQKINNGERQRANVPESLKNQRICF